MNKTYYAIKHIPSSTFATSEYIYCDQFRPSDKCSPYFFDSIQGAKWAIGKSVRIYRTAHTSPRKDKIEFLLKTEIVEVKQTLEFGPTVSIALFNEAFFK